MDFKKMLKDAWTTETEKPSMEEKLEKAAITMAADQKFALKQKLLEALLADLEKKIDYKDPLKCVKSLRKKWDNTNRGIHTLAAPSYQTLDNVDYHRLMRGWSTLHALGILCIDTIEARIKGVKKKEQKNNGNEEANNNEEKYMLFPSMTQTKRTIIDIKTLVQRLVSVLYVHAFRDAHLILLQSYSKDEVREKWAIVVKGEQRRPERITFTPEGASEL